MVEEYSAKPEARDKFLRCQLTSGAARHPRPRVSPNARIPLPRFLRAVKGGVKLDHRGGVKVDQYSMVEDQGLSGRRASGAEACPAPPGAGVGRGRRRRPPP